MAKMFYLEMQFVRIIRIISKNGESAANRDQSTEQWWGAPSRPPVLSGPGP